MGKSYKQMRNRYFSGDGLAATVWVDKYKNGEEGQPNDEATPDNMHLRMAKEFARVDGNYQVAEVKKAIDGPLDLSLYGSNRKDLTVGGIYGMFKDFKQIIPQGSIMSQLGNNDQIGSLSNCFVIGQPEDSYGGIMLKDQELVQLMKRRGGVGIDISTLRPAETPTSNAAKTSTGAVSFMERFSNSTREVAQNGRRGALMLSIDVRHPDVSDFVSIKNDRTKVTGANVSVSLRDDFMEAVKADEDYILRYPIDVDVQPQSPVEEYNVLEKRCEWDSEGNKIDVWLKKVKAKEVYANIIKNAWENAEPGQIFIDRHWNYSPDGVYEQYRGITTNPCGEIFMQAYDACRLMALNFYSFVENKFTNSAYIDYDKLYEISYEQQRLADNLVDLELEKITTIINKIKNDPEAEETKRVELELWQKIYKVAATGRRTGCGFTGLGDMIAAMGVNYDSEEGMDIIDKVMKTKMRGELDCTVDLAMLRGAFDGYDHDLEYVDGVGTNEFYNFIKKTYKAIYKRMIKYGRRNISFSTVAPTGSVSILTQTTSGLEPVFSIFPYLRRKKLNPNDVGVRVDFTDENGDQWQEFSVTHKGLMDYIRVSKSSEVIIDLYDREDKSKEEEEELVSLIVKFLSENKTPYCDSTANNIDWINRVKIQGIIQKYTTHSISSTINLPTDVTEEEVSEIYIKSWESNLKGVTIYRDGCRSGVLVTASESKEDEIVYNDAPKRPISLECEIYHPKVKGETYTVVIGLLKGKVYEVFASAEEIAKGHSVAYNKKIKSGHYRLISRAESEETIHDNIGINMSDEEEMFTRALSGALRHGMHVKYGVEMCNNGKGDITSFTKVIARTLKRYIEDGTTSTKTCLDCGATDSIIYEEGCQRCKICGSSKCG
jgi:ribonucleoside-diphosphate reductase alpha chain